MRRTCPDTDIIPTDPHATHKQLVHDPALDKTVIGQNNAVPKHISGAWHCRTAHPPPTSLH